MGDQGTRDEILARVRSAVTTVEPLSGAERPANRALSPSARGSLLREFEHASRLVGAEVTIVRTVADGYLRVSEILRAEGVRRVVLSPGAMAAPWHWAPEEFRAFDVVVRRVGLEGRVNDVMMTDAGITTAAFGLSDTGTLVVLSSAQEHRLDSVLPPIHVALLRAGAMLPGLAELLRTMAFEESFLRHSAVTLITGPSRTADIELTLTVGVHGPRKLYTIILDAAGEPPEAAS